MAAALATGLRGEIPDGVRQQMRDSGLAHLLAISGLHIGLVTAFVFALVRGGLALGPGFALRWPLKKIAAVVALLAAAIYMMLAGATVPTQRAFIMTAITLPAPGPVAMLMMVAGGLWVALWQRRWRLAGVVAFTLGLTGAGPVSQTDILIAEEARLVGLRSGGDVLHLSNPQAQPFVRDVWQRRTGADLTQAFPPPGQENGTLRCDG